MPGSAMTSSTILVRTAGQHLPPVSRNWLCPTVFRYRRIPPTVRPRSRRYSTSPLPGTRRGAVNPEPLRGVECPDHPFAHRRGQLGAVLPLDDAVSVIAEAQVAHIATDLA